MPVMSQKPRPTFVAEHTLWRAGHRAIVGVDEVGVGTIAGPLVAAAILLPTFSVASELDTLAKTWWEIRDSKDIANLKKVRLDALVRQSVLVGIGVVEVGERIITHNSNVLTRVASERALDNLGSPIEAVLIDGDVDLPEREATYRRVAKEHGATTSLSISAASIVANVYFNSIMAAYEEVYPEYGFAQHKGYPTPGHWEALRVHGPCPIHHLTRKKLRRALVARTFPVRPTSLESV
jgi:ribonuclease HII